MLAKEDFSIIVVDDLQFSCEVIKSGLKKAGFKDIRTANSANETMLMLNEKKADVILADFWMPEMNGLEMTDLIRRWDESNNRYTGIILLTAEDTTSSIVVAFDRGIDDFISKSTNQFELAARVYGTGRTAWMQNEIRKKNRELTHYYHQFDHLNLLDIETGLANIKQLRKTLASMITHCENRGGGVSLALIRVTTKENEPNGDTRKLQKGTLKTISNSLQLVLRPLDLIARYDEDTFAIALVYSDQTAFNPQVFERSSTSILKHTRLTSDQGDKLQLSISIWYNDEFESIPTIEQIFEQAESDFKVVSLTD